MKLCDKKVDSRRLSVKLYIKDWFGPALTSGCLLLVIGATSAAQAVYKTLNVRTQGVAARMHGERRKWGSS